jgi:hypothetical protein
LVFAGNGFRCPLTELAKRYGADTGSVTDIYLPNWFAHNISAIHAPLLVLMTYLHVRNHHRTRTPKNTRREEVQHEHDGSRLRRPSGARAGR